MPRTTGSRAGRPSAPRGTRFVSTKRVRCCSMSDSRELPQPTVLVLNDADVRACMPMNDAVAWMVEALRTLSGGDAVQPLRSLMWLPDRTGLLGLMPGYLGSPSALGIKVVTVMPGNH